MAEQSVDVKNNEAAQRYELEVGGASAFIQYERTGTRIVYLHTEVPPELEGRGIGGALAKSALEDARARQWTVVPLCPFVSAYIRRHQEYLPLVEQHYRSRLA
jgi:predicted GNAT family acetyltransferase